MTKQGPHGTLYRYVIKYRDTVEHANAWETRVWAYDREHAADKFFAGDADGWEITAVRLLESR